MTDVPNSWFVHRNGRQYGPFSYAQLNQLAAKGRLASTDRTKNGPDGRWIVAADVPGLSFPNPGKGLHAETGSIEHAGVIDGPPNQIQNAPPLVAPRAANPGPSSVTPHPEQAIPSNDSPEPSKNRGVLDRTQSDVFNMDEAAPFEIGLSATIQEFKSLDYGFLVPLRKIFSGSMLRKKAVRWVLGFGLFPLIVVFLKNQLGWTFEQCVWVLGGYFALFWGTYFYGILLPSPKTWRRGVKWAAFTVAIGLPLLFVAQELPVIRSFYSGTQSESFFIRLLGFIFGVGLLEETCKALPLLLFALRKGEKLALKDGIFLGMMSGFGFALAEVVQYSVKYWDGSALISAAAVAEAVDKSTTWSGAVNASAFSEQMKAVMPQLSDFYGGMVLAQIVRFMTLPLLHAVWAGIVGWFIVTASNRRERARAIVVLGIFFAAVLHGLYDVTSSGLIGIGVAAASIILFMGYLTHGQDETGQHAEC